MKIACVRVGDYYFEFELKSDEDCSRFCSMIDTIYEYVVESGIKFSVPLDPSWRDPGEDPGAFVNGLIRC